MTCSALCPPGPLLPSCFPVSQPPAYPGAWGCSYPDAALAFAELHDVPLGPFLQSIEDPVGGIIASGASTTPPCSVLSADLLAIQLASVAKLLLDILPHKASVRTFTNAREASCPGSPGSQGCELSATFGTSLKSRFVWQQPLLLHQ